MVGDILWLLGEEALEGGKEDLKKGMAPVVNQVISVGIRSQVLQARISEEALEAAGIIKSAADAKGRLQRLRTQALFII